MEGACFSGKESWPVTRMLPKGGVTATGWPYANTTALDCLLELVTALFSFETPFVLEYMGFHCTKTTCAYVFCVWRIPGYYATNQIP